MLAVIPSGKITAVIPRWHPDTFPGLFLSSMVCVFGHHPQGAGTGIKARDGM